VDKLYTLYTLYRLYTLYTLYKLYTLYTLYKLYTLRRQKWPRKNQVATAAPCYSYPYLAKTE